MPQVSANARRIAEIQDILRSGVVEDENDGSRVKFDHDSLRKELRSLQQQDPASAARRPVVAGINLGGF